MNFASLGNGQYVEKHELKPCPFCGNKDVEICEVWSGRFHGKAVNCNFTDGGCGANSGSRETEAEAIEAWNRRKYDR